MRGVGVELDGSDGRQPGLKLDKAWCKYFASRVMAVRPYDDGHAKGLAVLGLPVGREAFLSKRDAQVVDIAAEERVQKRSVTGS